MVLIVVVLSRGHAMSYRRYARISFGKEFFLETGVCATVATAATSSA